MAEVAVARDWELLREIARLAQQDAPPVLASTDSALFASWRAAVTKYHLKGWTQMTPSGWMRAREGEDITPAFSQLRSEQIDGVIVSQDGLFYATRKNIADLALAHQLPSIVYSRETLEAGAVASYGPSSIALFRRAGAYIN
jgi:hypothetical protein